MKEILDKLTSYNFFNYFFPGAIFIYCAKYIIDIEIVKNENIYSAFMYYFIGMIISRIGSLVVEPILRKIGFIEYSSYEEYVTISKLDSKLELFSEINNMYRTLIATMILLLVLKIFVYLNNNFYLINKLLPFIIIFLIIIIYFFSYKKQTDFINKRILINKSNIKNEKNN